FLAQAYIKSVHAPPSGQYTPCCGLEKQWVSIVIGLFLIVLGIGIIWSPVNLMPYIIGIFLIMVGVIIAAISLKNTRR
ncbi:MAG: hypothetical protein PHN79_04070, partial [Methanoregula sp.]|nr:hypothetical protein [Methanoregula sp.]